VVGDCEEVVELPVVGRIDGVLGEVEADQREVDQSRDLEK